MSGLRYVVEQNTGNYGHYCDRSQPYGCPAGDRAYYGRGPLQLSWNFNYKAAGDALHIDLLHDPYKVEKDAAVSWKTGLCFWNAQQGAGTMTPHDAMVHNKGFGESATASFFDIGGTSLDIIRLKHAVEERFEIDSLPVARIFTAPTVRGLADVLDAGCELSVIASVSTFSVIEAS